MKTYAGVTYTPEAEQQLEALIDQDIRYETESQEYDWLLRRDPENLSTLKEIDGKAIYIFITKQKRNGPQKLAVTWVVTTEPPHLVEIIDLRQMP